MKLFYITHVRMPTGRAHGFTIVKSCESFAQAGADVTFVLPALRTRAEGDIFDVYKLPRTFATRYLPVLDTLRISSSPTSFKIRITSFYISVWFFMLFCSRRDTVIYTRDVPLIYFLSVLGFKVAYECHMIPGNRRTFFRICKRAFRIITISKALRDAFVTEGFDGGSMLVAPSGVDLSTFSIDTPKEQVRREFHLPEDARIVVYTGNFTTMGADKGIADIIAALPELPDVHFGAIGGSEADIARYEALAREQHVAGRVHLSGQAPQATLGVYQRAADILLMPFPDTPHYRNHMSPVKMFEYMAGGRPIIASDLPTIREVLNDQNAVIVPPGNPSALAAAIHALFADPERMEQLAREARVEVVEYTWQRRAERIIAFLLSSS